MPKPLLHALIWSHEQKHYKLYSHGQPEQCFPPGDEPAFSRWLDGHTAFAFEGQAGRLSVLKEARSRGSGYWYAYRTHNRQTHKRYLGRTAQVTLAHLEEVAKALNSELSLSPPASELTAPTPEHGGALLSQEAPPLTTILTNLLNELGQVRREFILVLDDYHVIEDQAIHEAMLFLIDHFPPTLHLVLATRTDPEFPLSRLRVRGQLLEI